MYDDERDSIQRSEPETAKQQLDGNIGSHFASLSAVAMLTGIAIAVHTWMPPGNERMTLVLCLAGVGAWVLGAFALRLGFERAPLLTILSPAAIFLAVMIGILSVAHIDVVEGIESTTPVAEGRAQP